MEIDRPSANPNPYSASPLTQPPHNPVGHEAMSPMAESQTSEAQPDAHPATDRSHRWWSPLIIVLVSFPVFVIASFVMSIVALVVVHGKLDAAILSDPQQLLAVSESRVGLFIMLVLPQLAMVLPAVLAAWCSPTPLMKRLSLVRGHWPIWAWVGAAVAAPLVALISGLIVGQLMEESESLRQMTEIFRAHGESGFLLPLALMIGITPAICEEILFRGYVQTRWTGMHPLIGIVLASFFFAVYHLDPVHAVAVFPIGLYLGFISWRSGSLIPAMLAHFVNNFLSVILMVTGPAEENDVLAAPAIAATLGIIFLGGLGAVSTVVASYFYRGPTVSEVPPESVGSAGPFDPPTNDSLLPREDLT